MNAIAKRYNVSILALNCSFQHEDKGEFEFNFDEMWARKSDAQHISAGSYDVRILPKCMFRTLGTSMSAPVCKPRWDF